jgi:hypothetical protein
MSMNAISKGAKYKVLGTTDIPNCDCCGKTNLTRAVGLETEDGQVLNVGVICASKLLRQNYMGKTYKASAAAILSMGKRAKREGAVSYLTAS